MRGRARDLGDAADAVDIPEVLVVQHLRYRPVDVPGERRRVAAGGQGVAKAVAVVGEGRRHAAHGRRGVVARPVTVVGVFVSRV